MDRPLLRDLEREAERVLSRVDAARGLGVGLPPSPMLPLNAVVIAPPGHPAPSLGDLAGRFGAAVSLIVKAGADPAKLLTDGRVAEALRLRSPVLLLFEDAAEAAAFEKAAGLARASAKRAKAAAHAERGRRFARTRGTGAGHERDLQGPGHAARHI
jgi:hypothetical protein